MSPRVELLKPEGFPVLFITFATQPESAASIAERVVATARLELGGPADDQFFGWTRRRFRTSWLLANTSPTARARSIIMDAWGADFEAPWAPISLELPRADLSDGARALGEPRVVIYGPTLDLPEQP